MRFTVRLLKRGRRIPGKIDIGKHQMPHLITRKEREDFVHNLKIELSNEMWLSRPYLTAQEEKSLPNGTRFTAPEVRWIETREKQAEAEVFEFQNLKYRINIPPDVTLEERWGPLHTEARWEKSDELPINKFEKYSEMAQATTQPEQWPRAKEKWDEWGKIKGIKPNTMKED